MTELNTTEPIEQLFEKLNVQAVFGQPIQEGEITLIPVADLAVGFGFGSGQAPAAEEQEDEDDSPEGDPASGSGGGAGGKATPRGYIKITPDGVRFEFTIDENRVALAGIGMVAWSVFWVAKTIRAFARK